MTAGSPETIPVGFISDALESVRAQGLSCEEILERAELNTVFCDSAADGNISVKQLARLWRTVSAATADEAFGLGSRAMRPGSFDLMCTAAIHGGALRKAVKRALQVLNLILDEPRASLIVEGRNARVTLQETGEAKPAFAYRSYWVMLHGAMCWLVGRTIPLLQVDMTARFPAERSAFRVFHGTPVRFEQPSGQIVFDARFLKLPIVRSERSLAQFLRRAPENLLEGHFPDQGAADTVGRLLRTIAPNEWPDFKTICETLDLPSRTVRRRLEAEGQTFQALKDEIRRERAVEQLQATERAIADIAAELGYREPSAFYKSFHNWMGCSPGQYRVMVRDR